jgi:phage shock protein C
MTETAQPTDPSASAATAEPDPALGQVHEPQPRVRRLVRRRDDRMLAGVCSGIGDYVGMDANIVRLIVVLLAVFGGGAGIALYIAGWLLMPEEGATESVGAQLLGSIRS